MLPRLRFVFVAALIAALPWILLGSGIVTTAQNTPVSENVRPSQGVTVTAGDLRDAQHMHSLAFVRRSRELERLRDIASAPLSDWVAAPTGLPSSDEPAVAEDVTEHEDEAASLPPLVSPPQIVASLPTPPTAQAEVTPAPEPMVVVPTPEKIPAAEHERSAALGPADQGMVPGTVLDTVEVEPLLGRTTDWSKAAVPPLPKARTGEVQPQKSSTRRVRAKRYRQISQGDQVVQPNPFGLQRDPFAGPPATATLSNPALENGGVPY